MRVAVTWAGRKGLQGGVGVTKSPPKGSRTRGKRGRKGPGFIQSINQNARPAMPMAKQT